MKAALIQQTCSPDLQANLSASEQALREAADNGAQLAVLQELHGRPYFCQSQNPDYFNFAEALDGVTATFLSRVARELELVIVGSIFEKRLNGVYHNTALVFENDGSRAGMYRKMHIPDDPGYYEKYYFTPGDLGFTPIPTSVGNLGVLVCWDQWFPESARLMTLAGADLLIFPTAIGWDPNDSTEEKETQLDAWKTAQRAHAIFNRIPVLSVNRVGFEADPSNQTTGIQFWGNSFACDARGKIVADASSDSPSTIICPIDYHASTQQQHTWPYLRDRRIDAYSGLLKRVIDDTH